MRIAIAALVAFNVFLAGMILVKGTRPELSPRTNWFWPDDWRSPFK